MFLHTCLGGHDCTKGDDNGDHDVANATENFSSLRFHLFKVFVFVFRFRSRTAAVRSDFVTFRFRFRLCSDVVTFDLSVFLCHDLAKLMQASLCARCSIGS